MLVSRLRLRDFRGYAAAEVRHERPVQPKYSASRRFVLPAPFGPWTTVSRSPNATSAL